MFSIARAAGAGSITLSLQPRRIFQPAVGPASRRCRGVLTRIRWHPPGSIGRQQRPRRSRAEALSAKAGGARRRADYGWGQVIHMDKQLFRRLLILTSGVVLLNAAAATAQDRLCDPGDEDCRAILINYIRNETVGIDVAFWFMEDARYTDRADQEASGRRAGARADGSARERQLPAERRRGSSELQTAGIPMREAAHQLHPPLEDDAVPRPGRRRVQRRQLQRRRVAPAHRHALRELHRRGDLLHQRRRRSSTASGRSSTITG